MSSQNTLLVNMTKYPKYENMVQYKNMNKNLLCKKMNLHTCDERCPRSHSMEELPVVCCIDGINCSNYKYKTCPFIHPGDVLITKEDYYKRMYQFIAPYETDKKTVCRFVDIGCRISKCRKAHSVKELNISICDCYRKNCPFYHKQRDECLTKEEYYERLKSWVQTPNKLNKNMLCRYVDIGCRREDCPYAHNIQELIVHTCIFTDCKKNCVFMHRNETIDKYEYYERVYHYTQPLKPRTVLCDNKYCKDIKCKYAHSFNEFKVSDCIRENRCKKHCCPFKHPDDCLDKQVYYQRMKYSLFPN